ncbi:MAG: 6-phosphofructokinase [Chthoniobacterales bacterium]
MATKRIGILTSGGDCPGLNAVIRAVVRSAEKLDWEVVGILDGFEGLLPPGDHMILDRHNTSGVMHLGGTILGTTNRGHFMARAQPGSGIASDVISKARQTLTDLGIEGLIVVGGDGSLTIALQLQEAGIPVIGVPKTIDNDLEATAMTFGFDSAVSCVADALDRLHTTATSHKRVMVLEVMGRHTGWIALYGGLAGGADVILIPEIPFRLDNVAAEVMRRDRSGAKSTMIVVAEGAHVVDSRPFRQSGSGGEQRLGGIGDYVCHEIAKRTGKESRSCVLGHLQRGGAPTAMDRILGTRFGVKAVQLIAEGKFGTMVSFHNAQIEDVPISHAVHRLRTVPPDCQLIQSARDVEIHFGE